MLTLRSLTWPGRVFFLSTITGGVFAVPIGLYLHPLATQTVPTLLYLGVATQIAALLPVKWGRGQQYVWTAPMVAAGLVSPGGGVVLLAWLAMYDGRRPGRDVSLLIFLFNRSIMALTYGISSLLVTNLPRYEMWSVPLMTVVFGVFIVLINYPLTTLGFATAQRTAVSRVFAEALNATALVSVIFLAFTGGIVYVLLQAPSGYLLVIGLFGVLWVMRANVAYANHQREARLQTVQLAAQALDARDPFTESHSQRVSDLAVKLGAAMGAPSQMQESLRTAGHLHDLGKIGIPDQILMKASTLTPEEWEIMKTHAAVGAQMLERHSELAVIAPMVRAHHERWDGSGYPDGLSGESIPLGGRILAVADSYDTITEARLYRPTKLSPEAAVEDIMARAGWYDPAVVSALRQIHGLATSPPQPAQDSEGDSGLGGVALLRRRPRFRWLVAGMTISSLGDPLTQAASLVALFAASRSPLAIAAAYGTKSLASIITTGLLGFVPDRFERRRLVASLEMFRAALLFGAPLTLSFSVWLLLPLLFILSMINGIVVPARQAAVGELVRPSELRGANSLLTAGDMTAKVVGYPIAGLVLFASRSSVNWLFVLDALTFVAAGLTVLRIGPAGGGVVMSTKLGGAIAEVWGQTRARPHLIIAFGGTLFLSMSLPVLIELAYQFRDGGPAGYTALELGLSCGVVIGALLLSKTARFSPIIACSIGLAGTGAFSLAVAVAPTVAVGAVLLLLASIGNPVYAVGNQTALMQSVYSAMRGRVMAVRFGLVQVIVVVGSSIGAIIGMTLGPRWAYAVLGIGLCAVAGGALMLLNKRTAGLSGLGQESRERVSA